MEDNEDKKTLYDRFFDLLHCLWFMICLVLFIIVAKYCLESSFWESWDAFIDRIFDFFLK